MFKAYLAILSLVLMGAAHAQTIQGIENCRQLVDGADRVACYDALKPTEVPTPQPKTVTKLIDSGATQAQPTHTERSCKIFTLGLLAGPSNCQDGDVVSVSGLSARDVPDVVAEICDFGFQILTLPDASGSGLNGEPNYVILCKYHKRLSAPKQQ
ncbi:hypothetical protein [Mesorhizobium sp. WSM3224]|uniref:hypothetical protein n=1 Tax=Mesorhizobium sp. WSM3224 TaxID=1040986 RepID=UPI00047F4A66|nr:hypothetical protein [Mesorhizobium sp. WSM3224]